MKRRRQAGARPISELVLGVSGNAIACRDGAWHTHHSFGRVLELLAPRVRQIQYHAPQAADSGALYCDYPLVGANVTVCAWPTWRSSFHGMKRPDRILRQYWHMVRGCDALLLRGSHPLIWVAHLMAATFRRPVVHWIVGNLVAMMQGEGRGYGILAQRLGIQFARMEQRLTRTAARVSGAYILANGTELAHLFRSRRTIQVVSSSITDTDFLIREDTCVRDPIRLLFVGFIRPEKGVEYLLRSIPLLTTGRPIRLAIVGSSGRYTQERNQLVRLLDELGLSDRVTWEGYAAWGPELFDQMDRSDLLVLPSLTEGTPRVLVEARARSLPIVSTTVGGIPSSVIHDEDGLLVPPRDPAALAAAISRVIEDGDLRRGLIHRGRERVREWTIEHFVDLVVRLLSSPSGGFVDAARKTADNSAESVHLEHNAENAYRLARVREASC